MKSSTSENGLNISNCSNCGTKLPASSSFCPECGTAIDTTIELAAEMPTFSEMPTMDPSSAVSKPNLARLNPGTEFANRYLIEEQVGIGGMGIVFRAKDKLTDKVVALKLIHPERAASKNELSRLIDEGITSRDIRHKNVVAVYDVGEFNNQPYITMEFLPGRSLRQWHRFWQTSGNCIPIHLAIRVIGQILDALQAAHEAGVVHRDLKPENIMVTSESYDDVTIKILDFGIAKAIKSEPSSSGAMGTRGYMAPEQMTSPDLAGPVADIYSVSVIFYEMLTDVLPQGHWQAPSIGRNDVPAGIDNLIETGMSNRPANRIQSANEYSRLLMSSGGVPAFPGSATGLKASEPSESKPKSSYEDWFQKLSKYRTCPDWKEDPKGAVIWWCVVGFIVLVLIGGMIEVANSESGSEGTNDPVNQSQPDDFFGQNQSMNNPSDASGDFASGFQEGFNQSFYGNGY